MKKNVKASEQFVPTDRAGIIKPYLKSANFNKEDNIDSV